MTELYDKLGQSIIKLFIGLPCIVLFATVTADFGNPSIPVLTAWFMTISNFVKLYIKVKKLETDF